MKRVNDMLGAMFRSGMLVLIIILMAMEAQAGKLPKDEGKLAFLTILCIIFLHFQVHFVPFF